ncbi:MAG TPA: glycosyltransferase [Thermoleophilaceae bacterium]|nr:glycosyltransferase [Thermoleophilaceae bacterium]
MSRSLRILHVSEAFGGGIVGVVAPLAERLADAGHSVAVAYGVRPETPANVRNEVSPDVEVFPLPWHKRSMREQLSAAKALRRLAAEWEPDVVHLHSSFAGVVGAMALGRRYTLVYSPHGYSFTRTSDPAPRRFAYRLAERYLARRVDVVAAVSESEARLAREAAHAPLVEVVPNGIPQLDPGATPEPLERPFARVAGMGRADHQRQPDAAGRILSSVSDVAEVEWIGGGTPSDDGIRVLASHGVNVTGWLEKDEARERLANATAYLHWSAWDGRSLAVLEAMAHDVVVVASDIEPNREILSPLQICSSEEEAAQLLRAVVTDEAVRERLLADQRERREGFSAMEMAAEWEAVYTRAAARVDRGVILVAEARADVSSAP